MADSGMPPTTRDHIRSPAPAIAEVPPGHARAPQAPNWRSHDAVTVYRSVLEFFVEHCGYHGEDKDDETVPTSRRKSGLLRVACVGNPERTIQGDLFAFLKDRHGHVVLEYRLHNFSLVTDGRWENGRSIDIMVLDENYLPACAIELKHLGRVQGSVEALRKDLEGDLDRFGGLKTPLIQIGVYTDISTLPAGRKAYEFEAYRFISCYAYEKGGRQKKLKLSCNAEGDKGYGALKTWADCKCDEKRISFKGEPEEFQTAAGLVAGRVHYFIGKMKPIEQAKSAA